MIPKLWIPSMIFTALVLGLFLIAPGYPHEEGIRGIEEFVDSAIQELTERQDITEKCMIKYDVGLVCVTQEHAVMLYETQD